MRTYSPSQKQKKKRSDCLVFKVFKVCEFYDEDASVVQKVKEFISNERRRKSKWRYFLFLCTFK